MLFLLPLLLACLLARAYDVMDAVSASCALFVKSVMPGLFPYMVLSLMLVSRLPKHVPDWVLCCMGWCGGSPTGARLLRERGGLSPLRQRRIAVCCATMSPMFLMGTAARWLQSERAGMCLLVSSVLGGALAGALVPLWPCALPSDAPKVRSNGCISFGEAVEGAATTMLLVCGSMAMLRVAAEGVSTLLESWPQARLVLVTLLEVTCGTEEIAALPLPLPLRTAIIAGATGFGGAAIAMQNRAVMPRGLMGLPQQLCFQALHGMFSFGIALSMMLLSMT